MGLQRLTRIIAVSFKTGVCSLLLSAQAYGACGSPAGSDGEMKLISGTMYYCASTSWRALNNTNTGTACSPAGAIQYISSQILWCNGATWHTTAPATNHGSCVAGQAGLFYYDSGNTYYWFCNGSAWRKMGP